MVDRKGLTKYAYKAWLNIVSIISITKASAVFKFGKPVDK